MEKEFEIDIAQIDAPPPPDSAVVAALAYERPALPRDRALFLPEIHESPFKRWAYLILAVFIVFAPVMRIGPVEFPGGYLSWLLAYNAPAHPGVDQNGYQVGGKFFADTFSTGVMPANDYIYVGWMWVMAPDGWFYPKYPLGLPIIDAALIWIFGREHGIDCAYLVSPVCTALAVLAMFLMVRQAAGSFAGIVGMILLGTSQATLALANNSNSHAPCLAFVCWGMLWLTWWWRFGGWWRGILAGFLLGYALTIRYTEGLLLLPLLYACIMRVRWRIGRSYVRSAMPLIGWLIPTGLLVAFNLATMGDVTGYDSTNESTGFTVENFLKNWDFVIEQLYSTGLYFILPLVVLGFCLLMRWNWRLCLLMLLWFLPGLCIYASYYWGPRSPGVGYLRFFLTLFPPAVFAVAWLTHYLDRRFEERILPWPRVAIASVLSLFVLAGGCAFLLWKWEDSFTLPSAIATAVLLALIPACILGAGAGVVRPIAAGIIVALAAGFSVRQSVGGLERDFAVQSNLAHLGHRLYTQIPKIKSSFMQPLLFADGRQLLNYLQFRIDAECYSPTAFSQQAGARLMRGDDPDAPNPLQFARVKEARKVYENKKDADFQQEAQKIIQEALRAGRHVYTVQPAGSVNWFKRRFVNDQTMAVTVEKWRDPVAFTEAARNARIASAWGAAQQQNWELLEIKLKN